jgi:hypothetical protein
MHIKVFSRWRVVRLVLIEWVNAAQISQTFPGLILGFIQVKAKYCAVVQSSNDPISMEKMTQE